MNTSVHKFTVFHNMSYQNDFQEFQTLDDIQVKLLAEKGLVEKANIQSQEWFSKYVELNLEGMNREFEDNRLTFNIDLPEVAVHQNDGKIQLAKDVKRCNDYYNGGKNLYVPIWTQLKNYELVYDLSNHVFGVNQVRVMLTKHVNVYAYMYNPSESRSVANDELMLKPNLKK